MDGLRQREQQGAVGVGANRITKAFVRSVECTDAVVFAIAKCRLAPNVDAKFTVSGGRPCVLVHELGREPVLGGSRPPTRRDVGGQC